MYLMVNILFTIFFIAFHFLFDKVLSVPKYKVQSLEQLLFHTVMMKPLGLLFEYSHITLIFKVGELVVYVQKPSYL